MPSLFFAFPAVALLIGIGVGVRGLNQLGPLPVAPNIGDNEGASGNARRRAVAGKLILAVVLLMGGFIGLFICLGYATA